MATHVSCVLLARSKRPQGPPVVVRAAQEPSREPREERHATTVPQANGKMGQVQPFASTVLLGSSKVIRLKVPTRAKTAPSGHTRAPRGSSLLPTARLVSPGKYKCPLVRRHPTTVLTVQLASIRLTQQPQNVMIVQVEVQVHLDLHMLLLAMHGTLHLRDGVNAYLCF